jgi:hypothetical protein
MSLDLDEATHKYTWDSRPVPAVTRILADMGLVDPTWFTDEARDRGRYCHDLIHLHCIGELDDSMVTDSLRPYFDGWPLFLRDSGFVVEKSEQRIIHPLGLYAGTYDILGYFPGDKNKSSLGYRKSIIDVKTGSVQPSVRLQLALYEAIAGPARRYALALPGNGKYSLSPEYTDRADRDVALGLVAAWWWRKNNMNGGG